MFTGPSSTRIFFAYCKCLKSIIGAVVDSFSYVFQTTKNSKTISREEMRAFKKIWAEYSNPDTGFLEKDRFVAFFGVSTRSYWVSTWLTSCINYYRNSAVFLRSRSIQIPIRLRISSLNVKLTMITSMSYPMSSRMLMLGLLSKPSTKLTILLSGSAGIYMLISIPKL
jgi:hypothetical protein